MRSSLELPGWVLVILFFATDKYLRQATDAGRWFILAHGLEFKIGWATLVALMVRGWQWWRECRRMIHGEPASMIGLN